ncbi:MAG: DctP family TRAP transporter solute-binding subunit [Candidatus Accumulibacter sp.]|jgi:tripartite ATP-independent transporter DctP family solute receptor|nr:DctP family TRAP transporter solute-binding subunit [Accumulibacter sp.]
MFRKLAVAASLILAGSALAQAADTIVIKMAYGTAGGPIHDGALEFKKRLESLNSRIQVQVFPGGQLGSEGEVIGQLQTGMTDMLPTTTGPLGQQNPIYYVLETPYIFINDAQADRVLDGPVGEKLLKGMEAKGLIGLTFWENGFRQMSDNTRPIKAPADLKGLKMRTQQNRLHMKYFSDLGANPTPLPFTEIYNSLATKLVDGQENPFSLIATNKFYEQQKFVSKTDHVYSSVPVYYSKMKWDRLPPEVQKQIRDTVHEMRLWQRQLGRDQQNAYIEEISKKSQVYTLSDAEKAAFQKAAEPAFEWAKKEYGSAYETTLKEVLEAAQ